MSALSRLCPSLKALRSTALAAGLKATKCVVTAGRRYEHHHSHPDTTSTGINSLDEKGYTKLHRSIHLTCLGVESSLTHSQRLLEQGACPNIGTAQGVTPLHTVTSVSGGNPPDRIQALHLLLSKGARPNVVDQKKMTPLHHLMKHSNWGTAYFSEGLRVVMSVKLLHARANPCTFDVNGMTPLHHLLLSDVPAKVHTLAGFLVINGADPSIKDRFGSNAYSMTTDSELKWLMYHLAKEHHRT